VWCATQNAESALASVAQVAGLPTDKCEVHKTILGTGFGRRSRNDYVIQAVLIAKEMPGTPIKLIWSREEDIQHSTYHPITQCRLRGGLDSAGNLTALHLRVAGQSIMHSFGRLFHGVDPIALEGYAPGGQSTLGYAIPNLLVDYAMRNPHVPPGYWRGVNINQNAIYLECFIDELAHAAGQDPLAFRRRLMADHPAHRAVLDAAAARGGWGQALPAGHGRGLAAFMAYGSYVAACADVSIDGGRLAIRRVVVAIDPGHAVNPALIERQIEGCVCFGLSALIYGECTVKDGRIEQSNFHDYQSLRIAAMPEIVPIVMPSGGRWGGAGESPIAVAAPAVLNAVFAASGRRLRTIPLKNHGIALG
jgi:isoquinoline 1-oxidoreductase subunit beta